MSNNRVLARSGFRFAYGLLAFTVIVAIALALSFVYWKPNSTTSGDKSATTKPSVVTLSSDMTLAQAQSVFGGAPTPDQLVPGSQLSPADDEPVSVGGG